MLPLISSGLQTEQSTTTCPIPLRMLTHFRKQKPHWNPHSSWDQVKGRTWTEKNIGDFESTPFVDAFHQIFKYQHQTGRCFCLDGILPLRISLEKNGGNAKNLTKLHHRFTLFVFFPLPKARVPPLLPDLPGDLLTTLWFNFPPFFDGRASLEDCFLFLPPCFRFCCALFPSSSTLCMLTACIQKSPGRHIQKAYQIS